MFPHEATQTIFHYLTCSKLFLKKSQDQKIYPLQAFCIFKSLMQLEGLGIETSLLSRLTSFLFEGLSQDG